MEKVRERKGRRSRSAPGAVAFSGRKSVDQEGNKFNCDGRYLSERYGRYLTDPVDIVHFTWKRMKNQILMDWGK